MESASAFIGPLAQSNIETVEDDRILFPGDATFSYVEQARNNPKNNRVYVSNRARYSNLSDGLVRA